MQAVSKTASSFEILEQAFGLLQENGISRGAYARDKHGMVCGSTDRNAHQFCVVGAINNAHLALTGEFVSERSPVFSLLAPYMDEGRITEWNDAATDAEILSVVRSAINLEKSRLHDALTA